MNTINNYMHLTIIEYTSDAERKRIEYIFNKYDSEASEIDKISGISRIIRDDDVPDILSELYLRISPDNIKLFKLTEVRTKTTLDSNSIEVRVSGNKETIESFISYLLAQRKSIFKKKIGDNFKLYTSTTRKGYAEIKVGVFQKNEEVVVHIDIHAEEPNRSYLLDYFTEQLEIFSKSLA